MEQSISHLNSKMWYRLTKVVYIFILSISIFIAVAINVVDTEPKFDDEKSYIACSNGKQFTTKGLYLYSDYVGYSDDKTVKSWCSSSPGEDESYKLISTYTERAWGEMISNILLAFFVIGLVFEAIRRTFYYIVLGSLKPRK